MSARYHHTQKGGFLFYLAIIVFSLVYVFLIGGAVNRPLHGFDLFAIAVIPFFGGYIILMMSGLTVTVDAHSVRIRFGPGVFWKTYSLADISESLPVRNGWWWGYGIRWYIRGWLYNIAGMDAVEVRFKSGKHIRIGTDEAEQLAAAINEAAKPRSRTVSSLPSQTHEQ